MARALGCADDARFDCYALWMGSGMAVKPVEGAVRLLVEGEMAFDFVFREDDFFVSLSEPCRPSLCSGYWVDTAGRFVLEAEAGHWISGPIPVPLRPLVGSVGEITFLRFAEGGVVGGEGVAVGEEGGALMGVSP